MSIELLDVVELTHDIESEGLRKGDRGTIVHIYEAGALEVEFVEPDGFTKALLTLESDDVKKAELLNRVESKS